MADIEKRKDAQVDDDSSGDVPARDHGGLTSDKMTLKSFLAVVAIATQLMAYLNTLLMPSTILDYIVADLPTDPNYAWITVAWNLCASVLVTVGGRLSDIFGPAANVPDLLQAAALNTAEAYKQVPDITPKIITAAGRAVKLAYVDAFRLVYLVAIAFGVLSMIAAFFTRSIPPEKKTLMRAVHMENETGGPKAAEVTEI